jgi:hypothetical protein
VHFDSYTVGASSSNSAPQDSRGLVWMWQNAYLRQTPARVVYLCSWALLALRFAVVGLLCTVDWKFGILSPAKGVVRTGRLAQSRSVVGMVAHRPSTHAPHPATDMPAETTARAHLLRPRPLQPARSGTTPCSRLSSGKRKAEK